MKKILLILLVFIVIYSFASLYFLDKVYFLCPVEYPGDFIIRSDTRGDGFFSAPRSGKRIHDGLDLLAPIGEPVLASRFGRVLRAAHSRGMGNYIIIRHRGDITTIYGHLSQIYVKNGAFVRQGQVIGSVGKTGNANLRDIQPHLHFEVRKGGVPQDPLEYLP